MEHRSEAKRNSKASSEKKGFSSWSEIRKISFISYVAFAERNSSWERRWIVTPTYRQGKATTWKLMRQIFRDYDCQINESELLVRLPNDAEIAIKGAEQENNLRGAGLDMVNGRIFIYQATCMG